MKKLALILLLVSFAYPQNRVVKSFILKYGNNSNATQLNGTSQYWTKTSPSAFDFGTTVDFMMIALVKSPAPPASNSRIISKSVSPNPRIGLGALVTTGVAQFFISDGSTSVTYNSATNICDNQWHLVVATADRDGNATIYVDGVVSGTPTSIAAVGSLTAVGNLDIGSLSGANYWSGQILDVQIVRFAALPAEIASIITEVNNSWRRNGLPSNYSGGQIVAWYNWNSGGMDKSGSGNHLSKVNDPIIVKVKQ